MLEFSPIKLGDKPVIDAAMWAENSRSADFNFANIFMWNKTFRQSLAQIGGRAAIMLGYQEKPFFSFPCGSGDLRPAIEVLREYAAANGFPLCISGVTEDNVSRLEELFPGKFRFSGCRDHADYIYSAEKLAGLAGKKLHAKRNHINRFVENNDWSFQPLTPELICECSSMLENWEAVTEQNATLEEEHTAIYQAFRNYVNLGLEGGVLRSGERLIAFTIGEKISDDTYNIHFEKAYSDIQGAYPMINREFVRHILQIHPEIRYINREDDMGIESLRKAKLSYYPEFLVEKHTASWID